MACFDLPRGGFGNSLTSQVEAVELVSHKGRFKGYGFVTFDDATAVAKALEGTYTLDGRQLRREKRRGDCLLRATVTSPSLVH